MDKNTPHRRFASAKNGDDEVDCEMCQKNIDKTNTKKKQSAVMLLFCATHGHCMGFHVTPNERRRDAFLALFTYYAKAPITVFYDFVCRYQKARYKLENYVHVILFVCSLDEFIMNREGPWWKWTRALLDV